MVKPTYTVTLKNNLVIVKISGDWNIQVDIGYLTLLDETIARVRHQPWALVADIRGWRVSDEVVKYQHNKTIKIARNNQQAECWIVDSVEQGEHIQHHIENAGIPFYKSSKEQDVIFWLEDHGFCA